MYKNTCHAVCLVTSDWDFPYTLESQLREHRDLRKPWCNLQLMAEVDVQIRGKAVYAQIWDENKHNDVERRVDVQELDKYPKLLEATLFPGSTVPEAMRTGNKAPEGIVIFSRDDPRWVTHAA